MSELKPCPFCGGKASLSEVSFCLELMQFVCADCGTRFFMKDDIWNQRVYPPEVENTIEQVKPKKVFLYKETSQKHVNGDFYEVTYFDCPSCNNSIYLNNVDDLPNFCPECGQALDWSE